MGQSANYAMSHLCSCCRLAAKGQGMQSLSFTTATEILLNLLSSLFSPIRRHGFQKFLLKKHTFLETPSTLLGFQSRPYTALVGVLMMHKHHDLPIRARLTSPPTPAVY